MKSHELFEYLGPFFFVGAENVFNVLDITFGQPFIIRKKEDQFSTGK